MEDPRVKEAIQKLQTGKASEEDARIAFEAGYKGGPKTQEYYKSLGLLNEPTIEQPQKPSLEFTNNPTSAQNVEFKRTPLEILDMWNPLGAQFGAQQDPNLDIWKNKIQAVSTNGAIDPTKMSDQLAADQRRQELDTQTAQQVQADKEAFDARQARRQSTLERIKAAGRDFRNYSTGVSNPLSAWTPVGVAALGGRDRSGEATGYAAQAAQNQYNAAQNEKLRQQNMQQAMDNTIADKMAAAESDTGAKQVARELGPEVGAQGAAAEAASKIATPDLWKQKQLQNERRDVAAQNLAEVNRNKLMAIGNETNESMTNYATNVEDSQNAYKAALANANGKSETKTEDKSKEDTEEKEEEALANANGKSETKTEDKSKEDTEEKEEEALTTPAGGTPNTEETKSETTETQPAGTTSVAPSNQESEGAETVTDQMKAQQIHDRIEAIYKESEEAFKNRNAKKVRALAEEYDQLVADFEALPKEVKQIGYRRFDPWYSELDPHNAHYDYSKIVEAMNDRTL